uniref:Uncharacterized protein n=1 Tax=Opuntia streptacantha TaxID=393608 RepID=A0A7C9E1Y8_OPUST
MVSDLSNEEVCFADSCLKACFKSVMSDWLFCVSNRSLTHSKAPTATKRPSTSAKDPKPGSVNCPLVAGMCRPHDSALLRIAFASGCDVVFSTAAASWRTSELS